ncbi:MAG TPA: MarR family winged helix-turn-helix transcriptional regulator [Beijerinckiaceae bacterium]|jgi:DNA-binding MarR family transcriptional regulator
MTSISASTLARLVEQTSRALHSFGFSEGLYPAQWTALRYFAWAEPDQRTASALARFQGLAIGPVTRTVRTLMTKGLLENVDGRGRGRSRRVALTQAGRDRLAGDPMGAIVSALDTLDAKERQGFARGLEGVLRAAQGAQPDGVPRAAEPPSRKARILADAAHP